MALSSISPGSCYTKAQLIKVAEKDCDTSFTTARDSAGFYTAWNSIKTLVDKDLVDERGRPSRIYALTDEGWEVANRMRKATEDGEAGVGPSKTAGTTVVGGNFNDIVNLEEDLSDQEYQQISGVHLRTVGPAEPSIHKETAGSGQWLGGAVTDKFGTFAPPQERSEASRRDFQELLSSPVPQEEFDSDLELARTIRASLQDKVPPMLKQLVRPFERPSNSPEKDLRPDRQEYVPPSFEPIRLQPGTFSVQLVVDNREVYSKENRDYMETELIKKGVRPILRSLELGDFFWVAKCKDPSLLSRYGEEGDEVALDYIVERKTLEDLISSVKDGRFHEQKFRLRKSGVKNVIYLIEDKTLSQEHATKYHEMMESAIASTQVVEGYFVKRSQKIDDTVRYLARMTTMLKSLYEVPSFPLFLPPTPYFHTQLTPNHSQNPST